MSVCQTDTDVFCLCFIACREVPEPCVRLTRPIAALWSQANQGTMQNTSWHIQLISYFVSEYIKHAIDMHFRVLRG